MMTCVDCLPKIHFNFIKYKYLAFSIEKTLIKPNRYHSDRKKNVSKQCVFIYGTRRDVFIASRTSSKLRNRLENNKSGTLSCCG